MILKFLMFLGIVVASASAAEQANPGMNVLSGSLIAKLDDGLKEVNLYLDHGGVWPRITTDSFAAKHNISNQKDLALLSEHLLRILHATAEAKSPDNLDALEGEATLLFALAEKLWKADGYRNKATALLCCEFASLRCAKMVILSNGERMGPALPPLFRVRSSNDMLILFTSLMEENASLAESGMGAKLATELIAGDTWIEMLANLRKIQLNESTVGTLFNELVSLQMDPIGSIVSGDDVSALVFHYGWAQVMHESMLPALALYLKRGGSIDVLISEPANATKFVEVMKDGAYKYSIKPVMSGKVKGGQLAGLADSVRRPDGVLIRLFGVK